MDGKSLDSLKDQHEKLRLLLPETISDCKVDREKLKAIMDEFIFFDERVHLIVEGENLEGLKGVEKNYYGKVNVVCIDSTYNIRNGQIGTNTALQMQDAEV